MKLTTTASAMLVPTPDLQVRTSFVYLTNQQI